MPQVSRYSNLVGCTRTPTRPATHGFRDRELRAVITFEDEQSGTLVQSEDVRKPAGGIAESWTAARRD